MAARGFFTDQASGDDESNDEVAEAVGAAAKQGLGADVGGRRPDEPVGSAGAGSGRPCTAVVHRSSTLKRTD